ncbi:hypothetical protein V5799_029079 [Amblyomma americanum]|uniref:Uncharacterized protein n=1 Tax=Amblyomma americanum TaxID=6943 RepID=A0AAQ4ES86_AMBAM
MWSALVENICCYHGEVFVLTMSSCASARPAQVSSEAVVRTYWRRVRDVEPLVNAVVDERFDAALKEARAADELVQCSSPQELECTKPLLGVPFVTKCSVMVQACIYSQVNLSKLRIFYADDEGCKFFSRIHPDIKEALRRVCSYLGREFGSPVERIRLGEASLTSKMWAALFTASKCEPISRFFTDDDGRPINPWLELIKIFCGNSKHTFPAVLVTLLERHSMFKTDSDSTRYYLTMVFISRKCKSPPVFTCYRGKTILFVSFCPTTPGRRETQRCKN